MESFTAQFFDGETAARHTVRVALTDAGLHIAAGDDSFTHLWPYDRLTSSERPRADATLRLGTVDTPDARLIVDSAGFLAHLQSRAPALFASGLQRPATRRRLAIGVACVLITVIALWQGVPAVASTLAPLVPAEWVRGWGETLSIHVTNGARECEGPKGVDALQKMTNRLLVATDSTLPITVRVINHGSPELGIDVALMFDREVGNAAPRIEFVGRGKGRRRTDVETTATTAAVIGMALTRARSRVDSISAGV